MPAVDFSNLSADAAHRFRAVAELLHAHGKQMPARPKLLDVGGYPGTFAREFTFAYPRWQAMTLDQPKESIPNYTSGSGTNIPFPDESFDAVVSVDTFEHVPPRDRETFVAELCRVSTGLVLLAAPFHHDAVAAVERLLDATHRKVFETPHPWLHEHVSYGLPPLPMTLATWPTDFSVVDLRGSYDLQAWLTWQAMSLFRKLKGEVDRSWEAYDAACAAGPTPKVSAIPYRWVIVAQRGKRVRDFPGGVMPPPGVATETVELARLYCRMLEVTAGELDVKADAAASVFIEERLKQALYAAEVQIAQNQSRSSSTSDSLPRPGGEPAQRSSGFRRLFKR